MDIKFTSLHHINRDFNKPKKQNIETSIVLEQYIEKLFKEIDDPKKMKQSFLFMSDKNEVRSALQDLVQGVDQDKNAQIIAQRLLNKEIEAQNGLDQKKLKQTILKGSLFTVLVKFKSEDRLLICKADHNEFLDENSFTLRSGLPWNKKIFKAVIIIIKDDKVQKEVDVIDPNHSKYWYKEFLELRKKHTDKHNTETSMDIIDKKVFSGMRSRHPADYWILRNSFVGYFRSQESFEIENFISSLFENYEPEDKTLKIDTIVAKVRKIAREEDFDSSFTISKSDIKKRTIRKTIKITDAIELSINYDIPNFQQAIRSGENDDGQKYIQILTEKENIYREFLRTRSGE